MSKFKSIQRKLSADMKLAGTPEQIFPLLCPTKEYDWIEVWDCDLVHSRSGVAELDCVFQTNFEVDLETDTWVVCRYEPCERIEFVRINSYRAIRYTIMLHGDETGTTAIWSQTVTPLNEKGQALVEKLGADEYAGRMQMLEAMINHYLQTGEMLPGAASAHYETKD